MSSAAMVPVSSMEFKSGAESAIFGWLDALGFSCELYEDPFNPKRDTLCIYAPNGSLTARRGDWVTSVSDGLMIGEK